MRSGPSEAMAELVEYSLIVMVSVLFVAGSVMTYNSFSALESQLKFGGAYAAVTGLASQAVENGSSSGSLSLPMSTIKCEDGLLTVSSGQMSREQDLPVACDFNLHVSPGPHLLRFAVTSSRLILLVT
jgi:hypothetical protein